MKNKQFWKFGIAILIVVFAIFIVKNNFLSETGEVQDANIKDNSLIGDDAIEGDKDAPVTIVEFSDFECPYCGRFYSQTYLQLKEEYIDTGKVKLIFRNFPLSFHVNAQKAAEAFECAGDQDKFYEMHDLLFEKGVSGGVNTFKQYAQELGLNMDRFNECLDTGIKVAEIEEDISDGKAFGVRGTPAFFINDQFISGAQPFDVFKQAIEGELAK